MHERLGISILTELAIGAGFGLLIGAAMENIYLGITLGALGGTLIGWLMAAILIENEKSQRKN